MPGCLSAQKYDFVLDYRIIGQKPIHVGVTVGDNLVSAGLFSQHYGSPDGPNLPVARFGRISRMPTELPTPRWDDDDAFKRPAYLAEFLSWGGMSGSPVLWYREAAVPVGFELNEMNTRAITQTRSFVAFLGLVHGHFNIKKDLDVSAPDIANEYVGRVTVGLNSGLAVIVPASDILALTQPRQHENKCAIYILSELANHPRGRWSVGSRVMSCKTLPVLNAE